MTIKRNINVNSNTKSDNFPIHIAVKNNSLEIVKILVYSGAFINVKTKNNMTPLMIANHRNFKEIEKFLLKN